jgi:hypothetical protein
LQLGHGRYKLWAAVISVAFHIVVLSVLAAAKFHPESTQSTSSQPEQALLAKVKSITQNSPLVPKPNIRGGTDTHFIPRKPDLPVQGEVPAPKVRASDSEPVLATSSSCADLAWSQQGPASQEVKFFSSRARCKRLCYLVDCSGSMKGLLGQVKNELSRSITALRPDQYFGIIFFGDDRVKQFASGKLVRASQRSKTEALAFIKSVDAAGWTNALAGFESTVRMQNDDGAGPEVILFLTDGFELSTGDAYRFRQDIIELRQTYLAGCTINTIGFWPGENDRRLLESIAAFSGGQFVCISEAGYQGSSRSYGQK